MTSTGPSAPFINVSCFFEKQLKSHLLAVLDVGEEHLLLEVGTEHHLHLHAASFVPRLKPVVHLLMLQICYRFGHLGSQSCLTGCCSGALEGAVWTAGFALLCFRGSFVPFAFFGFLFLHIRTLQEKPFMLNSAQKPNVNLCHLSNVMLFSSWIGCPRSSLTEVD